MVISVAKLRRSSRHRPFVKGLRRRFLLIALFSIFFQSSVPYAFAASCPVLTGSNETSVSAVAQLTAHSHCSMAAASREAAPKGAQHKRSVEPTHAKPCSVCATIALFHNAVASGLLFLPPPLGLIASAELPGAPDQPRQQYATPFAARAPPSPV